MSLVRKKEPVFYDYPKYTEFPESEYLARYDKAKRLMKKNEIDLLMLTDEENVTYFTGFVSTHWEAKDLQPCWALMPSDGEPVIVHPEFFRGLAEGFSWIRDARGQLECHLEENVKALPKLIAEIIKEMGFADRTIGIESGHSLLMFRNIEDYEKLKASLPRAKFTSASKVIWGCREIKSPLEIDMMRKSQEITKKAYEKLDEASKDGKLSEGMSEKDVMKILKIGMIEEGADWYGRSGFHYMSCGKDRYPMIDGPALESAKIHKGDMLVMDIGCIYHLYQSDNARVAYVGDNPSERHRKIYDIILKSFRAGHDAIKPGARACDVWKPMADELKKGGYMALEITGHGIGLNTHEPPIIDPSETKILKPGMVFTIEPWIFDYPGADYKTGLGIFSIEDLILITDEGYEVLPGAIQGKESLWTLKV